MTKTLLVVFGLMAASLSDSFAENLSVRVGGKMREQPTRRPPVIAHQRPAVGALPRAARGNPLQMVNPLAPRKYYGTPDETVTYDQYNPSHITGIIFFGLRW